MVKVSCKRNENSFMLEMESEISISFRYYSILHLSMSCPPTNGYPHLVVISSWFSQVVGRCIRNKVLGTRRPHFIHRINLSFASWFSRTSFRAKTLCQLQCLLELLWKRSLPRPLSSGNQSICQGSVHYYFYSALQCTRQIYNVQTKSSGIFCT